MNLGSSDYKEKIYQVIRSFKKRVIIAFVLIISLSIIFWYYLIIFCDIYRNNQISWIQSTSISIAINMFIPLILCLFIGSLKYCGIKYNKKYIFVFGTFLYSII